jgi:hypothetical protein
MSDDFHRPTLTYPNGAYNPTQVRLYGISGIGDIIWSTKKAGSKTTTMKDVTVSVSRNEAPDEAEKIVNEVIDYIKKSKERSIEEISQDIVSGKASYIPIPPWWGNLELVYQLALDMKRNFGPVVISAKSNFSVTSGIIVGYSYEGHCYDLPKPKVMLIPAIPQPVPADDCGYDLKNAPTAYNQGQPKQDWDNKYRVWIVDKLDECVEIEVNQGFVEQIVLEANLPGKRAPNMYAGRMMMGHRGGRLSE